MADKAERTLRYHWPAYASECAGTALLLFLGLSAVIIDFAPHSPMVALIPSAFGRRLLTGLLFGGTGAAVAVSPLGRISGAHLDPVLSWAFWLCGSLSALDAFMYTLAQTAGAILGAQALAVWGAWGQNVQFGMTSPLPALGGWASVAGEVIVTFLFIGGILAFVGHDRLQRYTPVMIPPVVALLVGVEAPLSGTSMNPARSLGPALLAHHLGVMWIYLVGPAIGAFLAAALAAHETRVHVAKVAHHHHDPFGRFHGTAAGAPMVKLRRWLRRGS